MTKIASKLSNLYVSKEQGQKPLSSGESSRWRLLLTEVKPRDGQQSNRRRSNPENRSIVPAKTPANGSRPSMGGADHAVREQAFQAPNLFTSKMARTSQGKFNALTSVEVLGAEIKAQVNRAETSLDKAQFPGSFQTLLRRYERRELKAPNSPLLTGGQTTRDFAFEASSNWSETRDNTIKTAVLYPFLLYATGYLSQLPSSEWAASLPVGQEVSGPDLMDTRGCSDLKSKNTLLPQQSSNESHPNDFGKDYIAVVDQGFRGKAFPMKPTKPTSKHSGMHMQALSKRWPRKIWRVTFEVGAAGLWVRDFTLPRRQIVGLSMNLYRALRDRGIPIITVTVNGRRVISADHGQRQRYEEK